MDTDYNSIQSEITETLNILRPPVKRDQRIKQRNTGHGYKNVDLVQDFTQVFRTEEDATKRCNKGAKSSISLFLQKTCKRQIIKAYSVNSNGFPLQQNTSHVISSDTTNKPLLHITVIPRTSKKSLKQLFNKKQKTIRDLQKNNNQESYYQTKNVYLVVPGSKKDKVYNIKTTGTTKSHKEISNNNNDKTNADETWISEYTEMEKKKNQPAPDTDITNNCYCKQRLRRNIIQCGEESNKVRIYGQIGLNKKNEYFMECATINVQTAPVNSVSDINQKENHTYNDDNKTIKESQSTQVDINNATKPLNTRNQAIQCNLCNFHIESNNKYIKELEMNELKTTSNPLILITVYPKQQSFTQAVNESTLANTMDTQKWQSNQTEINDPYLINNESDTMRSTIRKPHYQNKKVNNKHSERASRSASPSNRAISPTPKNQTSKKFTQTLVTNTMIQSYKNRTQESSKKKRIQSPQSIRHQSPTYSEKNNKKRNDVSPTNTTAHFKVNNKSVKKNNSNNKPKDNKPNKLKVKDKIINTTQSISIDTNTKKTNTKKKNENKLVIKNDMNKSDVPLAANKLYKKSLPNNASKVSVNIDSEKEYYDVIFEKSPLSTDLFVRKTTKPYCFQTCSKEKVDEICDGNSDSLENFLPCEINCRQRRSISQTFNTAPGCPIIPITENQSKINVRDSLEISLRRDAKDVKSQSSKYLLDCDSIKDSDGARCSVPPKHFIGDDCDDCHPIQRDQEIRKLLGVDNHRTQTNAYYNHDEINDEKFDGVISQRHFQNALCKKNVSMSMFDNPNSYNYRRQNITNMICQRDNITYFNKDEGKRSAKNKKKSVIQKDAVIKLRNQLKNIEMNDAMITTLSTQYKSIQRSTRCLNKNQYHFNRQARPSQKAIIMLSRKQYSKVKKSLRKNQLIRYKSVLSIGEIKTKTKSQFMMYWHKGVQADLSTETKQRSKDAERHTQSHYYTRKDAGDNPTYVLFTGDNYIPSHSNVKSIRKTVSSTDIQYSNTVLKYEQTGSYINFESHGSSNEQRKQRDSVETLYRSNKNLRTPNLGTSYLSFLSEENKSMSKSESFATSSHDKKPFLRRLMSCLVMRTIKVSDIKEGHARRQPIAMKSSFDSYNISTSLGAIDMGTSLYDTSESFYTNHTIGPIINKNKRGFFNSVREFLTSRKS